MASPTSACPNCSTYVLEDTKQCLTCGYVFATGKVEEVLREKYVSEGAVPEVPCKECGAAVREHLVRCWNCRAFMRPEIAEAYEKMQERHRQVKFEPLPDLNPSTPVPGVGAQVDLDDDSPTYALAGQPEEFAEDDFEVDVELQDDDGDDFDFDGEAVADAAGAAPPVRRGSSDAPPVRNADAAGESSETEAAASGGDAETPKSAPVDPAADDLLDIAIQEEKETDKRRTTLQKKHAARAEARRKRRATGGGPPRGRAKKKKKAGPAAGKYKFWMDDVPLHVADPKKVKPKPGVLAKPTQAVDIGFAEDGLLIVSYVKEKSSLFGAKAKKPADARKEVLAHLTKDGKLEELPAERHWAIATDEARALPFEQPNEYEHETAFGGVPVFGDGRIGLKLPVGEEGEPLRFLVFSLTEYRRFAKFLAGTLRVRDYGADRGIPLADVPVKLTCHYTEAEFEALPDAAYHQADPKVELQLVGRRCQNCELVVSEDGRKKERIGGKTGSGIAKAKCPKCGEKFGDISLYAMVVKTPARPTAAVGT